VVHHELRSANPPKMLVLIKSILGGTTLDPDMLEDMDFKVPFWIHFVYQPHPLCIRIRDLFADSREFTDSLKFIYSTDD
jgi:hypothetical protein